MIKYNIYKNHKGKKKTILHMKTYFKVKILHTCTCITTQLSITGISKFLVI